MNILYIHNEYGKPSGEEHAAERIAALLVERGHVVQWFRRSSAELHRSAAGRVKGFLAGVHNPATAAALDSYLGSFRPDVALVQNIYPLLSPSIFPILRSWRIPVVMRCPNYRLFCPNGLHLARGKICERCLERGREWWCVLQNCENNRFKSVGYALHNAVARIRGSILSHVHLFLVQSGFQRDKFIRRGIPADRLEILPGMVQVTSLREPAPLGDVVAFIGRVSPEKGIKEFLEAARLLPEIPFAVAGDCVTMPTIHRGAPANVEWLGFLDEADLRQLYLRSRMIVVPSLCYEGFPNVLVQAMSLRKPVICSAIGGLPEILGPGSTDLLSKPGDVEDLVRRIRFLYARPSLCRRFGEAGYERVREEYSRENCYQRLMSIFEKAAHLRGSGVAETGPGLSRHASHADLQEVGTHGN